jgi:uncharacterized membrane protein SpoIIM required for sporulation
LPAEARRNLAARLAPRFIERFPKTVANDATYLASLHDLEAERRAGHHGVSGAMAGAVRIGAAAGDRLVADKRQRWREFQSMAQRATGSGLDSLSAGELPEFARRYREVAADLARARTYQVHPNVLLQLERIVATGHNLLYRDERNTWRLIWRFFLVEGPTAIVNARRHVLVAFLAFTLPAAAGFLMMRQQPALAEQILPVSLLERAEAGARDGARAERAFLATVIVTGNVQVAFVCFASGVLLGVGSLFALGFNGALIGAASGHYANSGLLGFLWTFIAGHGVLELFAIFLAAAAGLLLGQAIIAPGAYTRGHALVVNGRQAMALTGATVLLLLVAGGVEGFVSASGAPFEVKIGVSVASLLLLVAYLFRGRAAAIGKDQGAKQA